MRHAALPRLFLPSTLISLIRLLVCAPRFVLYAADDAPAMAGRNANIEGGMFQTLRCKVGVADCSDAKGEKLIKLHDDLVSE